ncbi:hypothetical protein Btru_048042 [Bulinus truncatus]|nr:hypothetical protein Btru_048042 [Bulinus truncatus]
MLLAGLAYDWEHVQLSDVMKRMYRVRGLLEIVVSVSTRPAPHIKHSRDLWVGSAGDCISAMNARNNREGKGCSRGDGDGQDVKTGRGGIQARREKKNVQPEACNERWKHKNVHKLQGPK